MDKLNTINDFVNVLFVVFIISGCSANHSTSPMEKANSKEDPWVNITNGLPTNTSYTLCSIEGVLYLYADYKFFRFSNYGDLWSQTDGTIPENTMVNAVTGINRIIFAATEGKGVFKSTDHGDNWIMTGDSGLNDQTMYVHSIAMNDQYLFIGAGNDAEVLRSSNDGATWTSCSTGLPSRNPVYYPKINQLLSEKNRLYACPDLSGIYYSENNGLQWFSMNYGLPSDAHIYNIAIADTLIYAVVFSLTSPGLYRCTESKIVWNKMPISVDMYSFTSPHFVSAQGSFVLFSKEDGIYQSTDYGSSWVMVNRQLCDSTSAHLYHSVIQNNYVFIPDNYHGIWRYTLNQ